MAGMSFKENPVFNNKSIDNKVFYSRTVRANLMFKIWSSYFLKGVKYLVQIVEKRTKEEC